ncbi:hypothetical protein ACH4S8_08040 [Streptomyces sp. NPDC021080]|uniref:hypothetical protein n=1 Tax=Streptomyces sp. NPDC021080 TaxID=3365110 RepID=UPI0037ABFF5A
MGETIKSLPGPAMEERDDAVIRACTDPWSWLQTDKYDMGEAVRVITPRLYRPLRDHLRP